MAYGARLESVLGASPRGFESPILRHRTPGPLQVPGFLLPAAPPDLRPPRVLPAREPSAPRASLGASSRSPARPRRPRGGLQSGGACGCEWPGPAAAHRHRGQALQTSGALHTGGTCGACAPASNRAVTALPSPGLVPLRLRGPRRSLRPGARPGPRPSQRASIGAGPSRCSSIRPRTPSRSGVAMSRVRPPA